MGPGKWISEEKILDYVIDRAGFHRPEWALQVYVFIGHSMHLCLLQFKFAPFWLKTNYKHPPTTDVPSPLNLDTDFSAFFLFCDKVYKNNKVI